MTDGRDFKSLQENVQSALVQTTRTVNTLANEDLQFQRMARRDTAGQLDNTAARLLRMANGLLKSAAGATSQRITALDDADDVDIQWKGIVDLLDSLLEKADTCLDEYTGMVKRKDVPIPEAGRDAKKQKFGDRLDWSMKHANIPKPQVKFDRKLVYSDEGPWKPVLTTKPHAILPLQDSLKMGGDNPLQKHYKHPYEHELSVIKFPASVFEKRPPIKYSPIDTSSPVWVDTFEGVLEMLDELKRAKEIAIDIEHHDFRTYAGLLSLMQISTRDKDWVVDTLQPWRHKLELLNEVFADPSIVKVLHGAFMDVIWLQRDLGLYIVGLFDTHHACQALNYSGQSLAFLLKKFVDFDADKKYQLADWRIRPLPDEMLYYARSDTHYLLYIYDMIRNELAEASNKEENLTQQVLDKSKEVSLQRYEGLQYDSETGLGSYGWFNPISRIKTPYTGEQFAVYKAVHKWRDDLARREDESPYYFITQHVLSDIAKIMPTDKKALWSVLGNNARGLKSHMDGLFELVQSARVQGQNGPSVVDFFRSLRETDDQASNTVPKTNPGNRAGPPAGSNGDLPGIAELRSARSQLWGDIAVSARWDAWSTAAEHRRPDGNIQVPFPYTPGTQDAVVDMEKMPAAAAPKPKSKDSTILPKEQQETFTLKRGRKHGSTALADPGLGEEKEPESGEAGLALAAAQTAASDGQVGHDGLIDGEDGGEEERKRREEKRAKKQAKRLKKKSKKEKERAEREDEDEDGEQDVGTPSDEREEAEDGEVQHGEMGVEKGDAASSSADKGEEERRVRIKAQRKARKEARRQARKAEIVSKKVGKRAEKKARNKAGGAVSSSTAATGTDSNGEEDEDEDDRQPFDYAAAPTVLHASKTGGIGGGGGGGGGGKGKSGKKAAKAFDPYANKTLDAPKGARQFNHERTGKSAVFKK